MCVAYEAASEVLQASER